MVFGYARKEIDNLFCVIFHERKFTLKVLKFNLAESRYRFSLSTAAKLD